MAKKKNKQEGVIVGPKSMEDFIWMSYRYCIGRQTIAAYAHADTIARVFRDNPQLLSDERKLFMSQDIMREITNKINWRHDVTLDMNYDIFDYGVFLVQATGLKMKPGTHYNVDIEGITTSEPSESGYHSPIDSDYNDLIGWLKLAYALDPKYHSKITTKFNGEINDDICIQYPQRQADGTYAMVWCPVRMVFEGPTMMYRVCDEYIIKIG